MLDGSDYWGSVSYLIYVDASLGSQMVLSMVDRQRVLIFPATREASEINMVRSAGAESHPLLWSTPLDKSPLD